MASTADLEAEILAELEEKQDAYVTPVNDVITIDPETRTIRLPASEMLFGVEEEKDVERKFFKCPRIVGDNIDLFTHQIYISYMAVKDENATLIPELLPETYWCEDVNVDDTGNYITFSWLLSGNVLRNRGFVGFAVIAKSLEGEMLKTRWKTAPAVGTVLMTIPDGGEAVAEMYPDIISQLLNRMDEVEAIATPETMQNYVEAYLAENPPSGMTAEEKAQLQKNTEDISSLSEEIANLKENGTGTGTVTSSVEPMEDDIPKVFIDGEIPTSKTDVLAELTYISKTDNFHSYLEIKCQGDSSLSYPKKNFTIKMFSDEARTIKLKKEFKGWGEHNKFVLKANWIDHSHARNIVSAKLWGQIVASRSNYASLPDGLKSSPNNGAIEGFPVKVYNNGTYQGIYTWNIPKDDWLYGIDEYDANQFVLYGQHNTNGVYAETATNFRKLWDGVSQSDREWEVEVGTNSDIVKTALNNVISLCMNADDVTFKNTLGNYLDVQSALDYYIFCYTICALDSLAQNMILVSYDGTKLYCSAYDLDSTFGLWWNGQSFVSTSYRCPEDYQEPYSLLWERIEKLYAEELKARYLELRNSVLSFHNMCTHFERFMDVIGLDLYVEDLTIYTGIPSGSTNNIKQIRNYIRDRLTYVDGEFENIGEKEPDTPDVTLSSISATYSGGNVTVGTALTSLTGIAVTAHYSDGSTSNVTDYTLSGTIAEGENTITVSYGGKTTTFTVTGVVMVGDDGIDYTLDALSGVTWTDGQTYNKNTGEVESVNGEHCTSKFTVQDCLYLFNLGNGNTYGRVYAWDENDNYLWSYEANGNFTYQLKPNYKYAVKVYNNGTFDSSLVSLIPVDHRETMGKRVAIDLSAITANEIGSNGSSYNFRYEINITDKVDGLITANNSVCNIDAVNRFSSHMIWHDSFNNAFPNIPTSATEPFIKLSAFQTNVLLCFYTNNTTITTVEEMVVYLQENNFNFILNDDPVIS